MSGWTPVTEDNVKQTAAANDWTPVDESKLPPKDDSFLGYSPTKSSKLNPMHILYGVGTAVDNTVRGTYHAFADAPHDGEAPETSPTVLRPLERGGLGLGRMFLDPLQDEYHKAEAADVQGDTAGKYGHAIASGVPVLGPLIAHLIEKGEDQPLQAIGEAGAYAAMPLVAKELPGMAGAVLDKGGAKLLDYSPEIGDAVTKTMRHASPYATAYEILHGNPEGAAAGVASQILAPKVGQLITGMTGVTGMGMQWLGSLLRADRDGGALPLPQTKTVLQKATASITPEQAAQIADTTLAKVRQNLDLRSANGESALRMVLTGQDNANLMRIAKSRGINVSQEASLKPGVADQRIIQKIMDDMQPDEIEEIGARYEQSNRFKHQFGDIGPEAWKTMAVQTYFPDVKLPAAVLKRTANAIQGANPVNPLAPQPMTIMNPADQPYFQAAKKSLGPNGSTSDVGKLAQRLKDQDQDLSSILQQSIDQANAKKQTVGSPQASAVDTKYFMQAKQELGPQATVSQIAQRAQQLKTTAARPKGKYGLTDADIPF